MFKLKNKILGECKKPQDPTAVLCYTTKEIVTDTIKIGKHALKCCVELLENRPPSKEYKEIIEMKHNIHEARMSEVLDEPEMALSLDMFHEAIIDLKKSKIEKYQFIIRCGDDLKNALFSQVWDTEKKPDQWRLDTLLQIHKKVPN